MHRGGSHHPVDERGTLQGDIGVGSDYVANPVRSDDGQRLHRVEQSPHGAQPCRQPRKGEDARAGASTSFLFFSFFGTTAFGFPAQLAGFFARSDLSALAVGHWCHPFSPLVCTCLHFSRAEGSARCSSVCIELDKKLFFYRCVNTTRYQIWISSFKITYIAVQRSSLTLGRSCPQPPAP